MIFMNPDFTNPMTHNTTPPVRVLHCVFELGGGGAERQLRNYLVEGSVPDLRHGVFAWMDGEFGSELRDRGIPVFVRPRSKSRPWTAVTGLAGVIQTWRPDLIQAWSSQFDVLGGLLGRLTGTMVVGNERNSRFAYESTAALGRHWATAPRPWVFRHCVSCVVANSEAGARYLRDDLRLPVPVHVIPNGLDLEALTTVPPVEPDALGLPGRGPLVFSGSRLVPHKRVDLIVTAVGLLRDRGVDCRVVVCGSGTHAGELEAMTVRLGLDDRVRFLGHRRDAVAVMKRSNIFCTASQGEGMPNAVLEAMACGLPVVASNIPEHRDLLEGPRAGLLVARESAEAMAEGLRSLIESPSLCDDLGSRARDTVSQYSVGRMCANFNSLYRDLSGASS